jgi:hypothetical protein
VNDEVETVNEQTVSWAQAFALATAVLTIVLALVISAMATKGLIDLDTFFQVAGYLGGILGAGGVGFMAGRKR